jgi:multidrug transporter EmrE-like cation transporter
MGMSMPAAVAVTIGFSILGVIGDYFLKLAADEEHSLRTLPFLVGFLVYASTAFGWVFVMKHLKLATIGVVYSVSMVLLLTAIGTVFFHESLGGPHGFLTTADFPALLTQVGRTQLTAAYTAAPRTFPPWCRQGTLSDFRVTNKVSVGARTAPREGA